MNWKQFIDTELKIMVIKVSTKLGRRIDKHKEKFNKEP